MRDAYNQAFVYLGYVPVGRACVFAVCDVKIVVFYVTLFDEVICYAGDVVAVVDVCKFIYLGQTLFAGAFTMTLFLFFVALAMYSIRAQRYVSLWCCTGSSVMYVPSCNFILLPLCKLNVIFELFVGKLVLISEIVF